MVTLSSYNMSTNKRKFDDYSATATAAAAAAAATAATNPKFRSATPPASLAFPGASVLVGKLLKPPGF